MNKGFIQQTAYDYDLPYEIVENIYNKWHDKGLFYEKLEEHLKIKSQLR